MLQPVVRRTWAPKGETPVQRSWDRHDRWSVQGALSLSPQRRRVGLYFRLQDHNVRAVDAVSFVQQLRYHLGPRLLLVWDRLTAHRTAAKELSATYGDQVAIHWLPAYAPQVNPAELVWSHTKYGDLANFLPEDAEDLRQAVHGSLTQQQETPQLLRSFFKHAGLKL